MSKFRTIKLTTAEINQILSLIYENQREGWYYDRKDYWIKRNKSIIEKLESEGKNEQQKY